MIKNKINNLKNTRIIYRNGDPMSVCKKYKKLSFFLAMLFFLSLLFTNSICSVNLSRIDDIVVTGGP
jgi:hypothetical protein